MERKRVAGRFVRENEGEGAKVVKRSAVGAPRPKNCRTFTRKRVAEALPEIVEKLVEEAKKGSIAHTKILMIVGGLDKSSEMPKAKKRRGKSVVGRLLDDLRRQPVE